MTTIRSHLCCKWLVLRYSRKKNLSSNHKYKCLIFLKKNTEILMVWSDRTKNVYFSPQQTKSGCEAKDQFTNENSSFPLSGRVEDLWCCGFYHYAIWKSSIKITTSIHLLLHHYNTWYMVQPNVDLSSRSTYSLWCTQCRGLNFSFPFMQAEGFFLLGQVPMLNMLRSENKSCILGTPVCVCLFSAD